MRIFRCIIGLFFLISGGLSFAEEQPQPVHSLDEIVVTGTKTQHTLKDVPVETVVLNREDIKAVNAENVMGVLNTIPGIHMANHEDVFGTYTWRATMGGLPFDSGYALVLIDGERVMGCGASGGMGEYGIGLNQIPVNMIERIEVVKGPGSALYGSDAMAGVINIITRKIPKNPSGTAGMSYGRYNVKRENADGSKEDAPGHRVMNQSYISYGDKINERTGYLFYYNYEGADDVAATPLPSERHSFMGKVESKMGNNVDMSLKYEAGEYNKEAGSSSRYEENRGLAAKADIQINPEHMFNISAYTYTWDFTHGAPGSSNGYKVGDVGYNHGEVQYTWDMANKNIFTAGVEMLQQGIDYTIINSNGSLVVVDKTVDVNSLYLQDEIKLGEALTMVAGARYDDHSTFGDELNPKFSLMYKPLENTTVRASAGKSFKSPTIRQLYYSSPYQHSTYYTQSNPDLKPEKAIGYTAGIEQCFFENRVVMNLGYTRNDVKDMVVDEDTGTLYSGLPLRTYRNVKKANIESLEFMCRARFSSIFSFLLSYTYMNTENEETGADLTYVPEHAVSVVPSLKLFDGRMGLSTTLRYSSAQYTNLENTAKIDGSVSGDAKMELALSKNASVSIEADNVFDSAKGQSGAWQVGRSYMTKVDMTF